LSERAAKILASWSCSPKSFTSVAPGAEKRSVIWSPIAALRLARSRVKPAMRVPMDRAGKRNTGNNNRDTSVICHDVESITTNVTPKVTIFITTVASVGAMAGCAPITSLLGRETSGPVRVGLKKAIVIFVRDEMLQAVGRK